MRISRRLALLTLLATPLSVPAFAQTPPAVGRTPQMLADQLVDEAFSYTRDSSVKPAEAATRASLLLELAVRLAPQDARILRLLAEAAQVAGRSEAQRTALRALIKVDAGDLVAQVTYLDFVAGATDALDERARIYQAAFDGPSLNPQIRSEMGTRLARIAYERGDAAGARELLRQALALNDVNVGALREWVRISEKAPDERVRALAALLIANPYQADAWLTLARLLETANVHGRAADALAASIEQTQKDGGQPPADVFEEMAIELAISARRAEAYPVLSQLASLNDAPLSALVATRLVANEVVEMPTAAPAPTTAPATTRPLRGAAAAAPPLPAAPVARDLTIALRTRLLDSLKSKTLPALAEAAWIELSVMPATSRDVEGWLNDYADLAPNKGADDKVLARLRGWWLLRQGKAAEAQAALSPLADADPLAQLGVARSLVEQNQRDAAARQLQDLWNQNPTGIFALQVAQTARTAGIQLSDTRLSAQYSQVLAAIPASFWTVHRQPRDIELLTPSDLQARYNIGDPISLKLTISNVSGRALSVGPDGAIKTTVGVIGVIRSAPPLGMYAVENLQRVYRLEPRGRVSGSIRLDQGRLGSIFAANPTRAFETSFSILTAPRGTPQQAQYGLGGQVVTIQPPGVTRLGVPLTAQSAGTELDTIFRDMAGDDPQKQLVAISTVSSLVGQLGPLQKDGNSKVEVARNLLCHNLLTEIKSPSAIVRAWTVRAIPAVGLTAELAAAAKALSNDPDPIVRASWATNEVIIAAGGTAAEKAATVAEINNQAAMDPDPVVKDWMRSIVKDLTAATTQPAQ
mgnify:CR=1 FL=1